MAFILLASWTTVPAQAADFEVQNTMEDALYGGAIGALIGTGAMLISSQPSKHMDYVVSGAGFGLIIGAVYGIASGSRAFAKVEDGKVQVGMPVPEIELASNGQVKGISLPLLESHF
jgi:putative Ca2+/H+ antiporter (TMEM165/GDT1 family)